MVTNTHRSSMNHAETPQDKGTQLLSAWKRTLTSSLNCEMFQPRITGFRSWLKSLMNFPFILFFGCQDFQSYHSFVLSTWHFPSISSYMFCVSNPNSKLECQKLLHYQCCWLLVRRKYGHWHYTCLQTHMTKLCFPGQISIAS